MEEHILVIEWVIYPLSSLTDYIFLPYHQQIETCENIQTELISGIKICNDKLEITINQLLVGDDLSRQTYIRNTSSSSKSNTSNIRDSISIKNNLIP